MKVSKDKLLIFSFVALIVLGAIISYTSRNIVPSKAAAPGGVDISLSAPISTLAVNQDTVVTVTVTTADATKKISGIDLIFTTTGGLSMTAATAPVGIGGGTLSTTEFFKQVSANRTRLSYAFLNPDAELPPSVSFQLTVRGTAAGTGTLVFDKASSLVVGTIAGNNYEVPVLQPMSFTIGSGGGTVAPTTGTSPTADPNVPSINVRLSPNTGTQALNTPFIVSLIIDGQQAGQKISAFDIKLKANPSVLRINSVGEPIDTTAGNGSMYTKLVNTVNATTGDISLNYISIQPEASLPGSAKLDINLTGIANGAGTLQIVSSQVTGNITQNAYTVIPTAGQYTIGSSTVTPSVTGSLSPTVTGTLSPTVSVTGNPTPTTPTGSVVMNLKLKFQGIIRQPTGAANSLRVQVIVAKEGFTSAPQTGTFTADASGIWTGTVAFNDVQPGGGYRVYVKGPKHLQKKICDPAPSETAAGTYRCADGKVTIASGQNTFDFSKVYLLVGDLPGQGGAQDGVVDSYDTSFIKLNLGSREANALTTADLNLDGIVDTQDYSLVIAALTIKYDEL